MSSTLLASPLIEETFMDANFTPSFEITSGALAGSPSLDLVSRACTIVSSWAVVYGWKLIRTMPMKKAQSQHHDDRSLESSPPRRLRTLPVITRSGRSMVFATAKTINLEFINVGQLKKL